MEEQGHKTAKQSLGWNISVSFLRCKYFMKYSIDNSDHQGPDWRGFQLLWCLIVFSGCLALFSGNGEVTVGMENNAGPAPAWLGGNAPTRVA